LTEFYLRSTWKGSRGKQSRTKRKWRGANGCWEWAREKLSQEKKNRSHRGGKDTWGKKEGKTTQGGNYTVLGRLSVPGTKRKYIVTQDELKRRIMAENMSNNLLRSLIRVCICPT